MVKELQRLRRSIYESYAQSVGLDPDAYYVLGAPLRPLVPLDATRGGLFLIGAYPSARFQQIDGVRDVPVGDNLGPFESERWFDGVRVRKQRSAIELEELFLAPMELDRANCWITNLVKVFLFKKGHRKKYEQLSASPPAGYRRECFRELGERSVPFLERELKLAKPTSCRHSRQGGCWRAPRRPVAACPECFACPRGHGTLPGWDDAAYSALCASRNTDAVSPVAQSSYVAELASAT